MLSLSFLDSLNCIHGNGHLSIYPKSELHILLSVTSDYTFSMSLSGILELELPNVSAGLEVRSSTKAVCAPPYC